MYITYLEEWIEQERNRAQSQEQQLEERIQKLEELIGTMVDVAKDFGEMYAGKLEGVE